MFPHDEETVMEFDEFEISLRVSRHKPQIHKARELQKDV